MNTGQVDVESGAQLSKEAVYTPRGSKPITVTTSATLLSALVSGGIPAGAKWGRLQPLGGDVFITELSTDTPVASNSGGSQKVFDGEKYPLDAGLFGVKLIAASSTTCTVAFYS